MKLNFNKIETMDKNIVKVAKKLAERYPDIVFGGSFALKMVGCIERDCHDLDVLLPNYIFGKYTDEKWCLTGSSNGSGDKNLVTIKLDDVIVDVFKYRKMDSFDYIYEGFVFKLQNLDLIINAKLRYIKDQHNVESVRKHLTDLLEIGTPSKDIIEAINKSNLFNPNNKSF